MPIMLEVRLQYSAQLHTYFIALEHNAVVAGIKIVPGFMCKF